MEIINEATINRLESIRKARVDSPLDTKVDKVEQERSARAEDLTGGYSYTSQFQDQRKLANMAREYHRSRGITMTPNYDDLEESRRLPPNKRDP